MEYLVEIGIGLFVFGLLYIYHIIQCNKQYYLAQIHSTIAIVKIKRKLSPEGKIEFTNAVREVEKEFNSLDDKSNFFKLEE